MVEIAPEGELLAVAYDLVGAKVWKAFFGGFLTSCIQLRTQCQCGKPLFIERVAHAVDVQDDDGVVSQGLGCLHASSTRLRAWR